ncbi:MAG: energy transducer TonB [Bryobacteraceae bacterium]
MAEAGHIDILEQRESLGGAFVSSLAVHAALAGVIVGFALWEGGPIRTFGVPDAIGGGTPIQPVSALPLHARTPRLQPVARDTESLVPDKPETRPKREVPDPDAVGLSKKDRAKKKKQDPKLDLSAYLDRRRKMLDEEKDNQVYSKSGAAASSPMMGGKPGTGNLGFGDGNPFGDRFGYYADLVRTCLARQWDTGSVDGALRQAPTVTMRFEILRNGTVRNVGVFQSSGNLSLDYSCRRAVEECSPFPALPAGFERNSARVEFKFQLKR